MILTTLEKKKFNIDDDIYIKLSRRKRNFKIIDNTIHLCCEYKTIPLWKIIRRFNFPGYKAKYKDNNFLNLTRDNILIVKER